MKNPHHHPLAANAKRDLISAMNGMLMVDRYGKVWRLLFTPSEDNQSISIRWQYYFHDQATDSKFWRFYYGSPPLPFVESILSDGEGNPIFGDLPRLKSLYLHPENDPPANKTVVVTPTTLREEKEKAAPTTGAPGDVLKVDSIGPQWVTPEITYPEINYKEAVASNHVIIYNPYKSDFPRIRSWEFKKKNEALSWDIEELVYFDFADRRGLLMEKMG